MPRTDYVRRWRRFLADRRLGAALLLAATALGVVLLLLSVPKTSPVIGEEEATEPPATEPSAPARKVDQVLDVIIRGGTVLDGSGEPPFLADVGVTGDRIVLVGNLDGVRARREVAAAGLFVTPGFINSHSHTYERIFTNPDAASAVCQGITLEVGGVDGRSPINLAGHFALVEEIGSGVNYALFVGQGSVRRQVMGTATREATAAEITRMAALVTQAMVDGAFGVSTGLEYAPGCNTGTAELIAVTRAAVRAGGPGTVYVTHMRSEGDYIARALAEAIEIARASGASLQLSHLKLVDPENWGKAGDVLAFIEEARAGGLVLLADVYPYLVPDYTLNLPLRYAYELFDPAYTLVTRCAEETWLGRPLEEVGAGLGLDSTGTAELMLERAPGTAVAVEVLSGAFLRRVITEPWSTVSTDASAKPWFSDAAEVAGVHPRTYGTYPLFLSHYVRDEELVDWATGIHMITGRPAAFLGISDRGLIREGYKADIVVFDPSVLEDRATYVNPQAYPAGIEWVFVNGTPVVERGEHLEGARPGQVVRRVVQSAAEPVDEREEIRTAR